MDAPVQPLARRSDWEDPDDVSSWRYVELRVSFEVEREGPLPTEVKWRVRTDQLPDGRTPHTNRTFIRFPQSVWDLARKFSRRTAKLADAVQLGQLLSERAFADNDALAAIMAWRNLRKHRRPMRIVFRFDRMDGLIQSLPWELVYVSNGPRKEHSDWNCFLALEREISVVRQVPQQSAPGEEVRDRSEVRRLLLLLADPDPNRRLDVSGHRSAIRSALGHLRLLSAEDCLPPNTRGLEEIRRGFHIAHISGHAQPAQVVAGVSSEATMLLGDTKEGPDPIPAGTLASLLSRTNIAVLSACNTAQAETDLPMYGLCATINRHGVPGVVGMQTAFLADSAIEFARRFYEYLSTGEPLDAAVSHGRAHLARKRDDPRSLEAFSPVLYQNYEMRPVCRVPNSHLRHSEGATTMIKKNRGLRAFVRWLGALLTAIGLSGSITIGVSEAHLGALFWILLTATALTALTTALYDETLRRYVLYLVEKQKHLRSLETKLVELRQPPEAMHHRNDGETDDGEIDLEYRTKVFALYYSDPWRLVTVSARDGLIDVSYTR